MTFTVLACGIGLFIAALTTHVLLWNLFCIRKEVLWLIIVFMVIPLIILITLCATGCLDITVATAAGLLHMALAAVYVQTYPALREDIPSIRILMLVHENYGGMTRHELVAQLARHKLFETKILDLENDSFIRVMDGRMTLTTAGTVLAATFYFYRRLLRCDAGKG